MSIYSAMDYLADELKRPDNRYGYNKNKIHVSPQHDLDVVSKLWILALWVFGSLLCFGVIFAVLGWVGAVVYGIITLRVVGIIWGWE